MAAEYITPSTTALRNLLTATDWSEPTGKRWRILMAIGIIITAAATLCIHIETNAVVAHIPSRSMRGLRCIGGHLFKPNFSIAHSLLLVPARIEIFGLGLNPLSLSLEVDLNEGTRKPVAAVN
ncbi:hypothetical protein ACFX2B_002771 [Malus domestica]